jgi:DNA-binding CsgD family transcriptional regulator
LTQAGVLARGDYRHPVAREAVLADIEPAERAALNQRAAMLAHRSGAASSTVAEHLLGAGLVRDEWAVSALEDAARRALRDGQVPDAVRHLDLARRACTDDRRRARITVTRLRAEWRINPGSSADHLPELVAALRAGQLGGGDAVVLAKALLWHGRFATAEEVLRLVGTGADRADEECRAEIAFIRPLLRVTYPEFLPLVGRPSARTDLMLTVTASQRLVAAEQLAAVLTRGPSEHLVTTVERVLRNCRLDDTSLDTVECALLALAYGGRPELAELWCDSFVEAASGRHAPGWHARLAAVRAEIAIRVGDLRAAGRYARQAFALVPPPGWGVAVGMPLAALILAATATGDLEAVREHLDEQVPAEMFQTRHGLYYLYARGRYSLAIDELPLALRDFERCGDLVAQWKLDVPGLIPWRVDAAETLLRMNRPGEARRLVVEQLDRCGAGEPRVRAMALRLSAAAGTLWRRPALLQEAARLHTDGDRYELARTLADLAAALQALGRHREAAPVKRRARTAADRSGAFPLVKSLSRKATWEDLNDRGAVPALLSEAERRVAALAAAGYTNREIAKKLYITMSTVEQHLTHTYRKLNVTRRTDLPADLDRDLSMTG